MSRKVTAERERRDERQSVYENKRDRIERLGFSPNVARQLAAQDVDVHLLERLVESGCDRRTAKRIVAPVEERVYQT